MIESKLSSEALGNLVDYMQLEKDVQANSVSHMVDQLLYVALAPKTSREEKLKMLVEGLVAVKVYVQTNDPKVIDLLQIKE